MKTAIVKNGKIILTETERPNLSLGRGAILKVYGCGVCGSDILKINKDGAVLGHEVVGEILEINCEAGFAAGDRIATAHHIPCFDCDYCKNDHHSMCAHFKSTNIFPGGFAEYIYVSEEHLKNVAYKIPVGMSFEEMSFYEPLGCCVRAIRRVFAERNIHQACGGSSGKCGDAPQALVIGLGSIGLLMSQALKAYGIDVSACDIREERVELAKKYGVKAFNSAGSEFSGESFDAIFMTSGADAAIDFALKSVRDGGKILIFASTPKNFGYANNEIYYRELTILGSYSPAPVDLAEAFGLLTSGKVRVDGLTTTYKFSEIQKAFCDTIENKTFKAFVRME